LSVENSLIPNDYPALLQTLKERIRNAQIKAALSVNKEMVLLYWQIGREILSKQKLEGWGAKIIDKLADDLRLEFPDLKGFSSRNLKYMRAFAEAWPDEQFVQQVVAQLPWGHNVRLLDYVKDTNAREWYICATIHNGWSRNVLVHQIELDLYHRQGQSITNFELTLPKPQSDLAQQVLKDPYTFDFLNIGSEVRERDLENSLVAHIRDFLLELGVGFAFVGSQRHIEIGGEDFYLDLLFYHLKLRCFVVIEVKTGVFKAEYAGKMNLYLSAVDDLLRHQDDRSAIGLILCKDKNRIIVEYALRDTHKPIGVSSYVTTQALPDELKGNLPTIEELEREFEGSA